eukprot:TRINITY_DN1263_c0_g2_i1.p1 TRINITY_DN1263_c0_g2~~TRINITY_DN1263_c0_g2_i1.p1  ORF type:complete len:127 (+),score=3.56 TRINITY_DN1263_c0_g2_i1:743-1123(+)
MTWAHCVTPRYCLVPPRRAHVRLGLDGVKLLSASQLRWGRGVFFFEQRDRVTSLAVLMDGGLHSAKQTSVWAGAEPASIISHSVCGVYCVPGCLRSVPNLCACLLFCEGARFAAPLSEDTHHQHHV